MKIRAVKLRIATGDGEYGFYFSFGPNLTVIRAKNSSGKSTLFNTLLYALGMEELVGGRDERVLPYGVQQYFEYEDRRIFVVASEVLLEIENSRGEVVTLRRSIKHEHKQSKLIEIFTGPCLTGGEPLSQPKSTYVHDAGGAQREEGFHRYLERYLDLQLPMVPTTSGGQVKLYLQTVFAALAVEQKRGWTDYIAGIPFYGIRESRTRVVEFLLGLDVFDLNSLRTSLDSASMQIYNEWSLLADEIRRYAQENAVNVENLPSKPDALLDVRNVQFVKFDGTKTYSLIEHVSLLRDEYRRLEEHVNGYQKNASQSSIAEFEKSSDGLRELTYLHEQAINTLNLYRASLREYQQLLDEIKEDLERNSTTKKLRSLGATLEIALAGDQCPTCRQLVVDSLLNEVVSGPLMSLEENISYLKSQKKMLEDQISGTQQAIQRGQVNVSELSRQITLKQKHLNALRGDISTGAVESRALLRRQVQIEGEVEGIEKLQQKLSAASEKLAALVKRMAENKAARQQLPANKYSESDEQTISLFQSMFRANAGSFGYESATIRDIQIHRDSLTPVLQELELREISKRVPDIAHNSSASDFVRLIWSYLLALYQTASHKTVGGNHPGLLMLDEPGQHSMRTESQHALLRELAALPNLQSIVAASFDENKSVFELATDGVKYHLIEWEEKLICPLPNNG